MAKRTGAATILKAARLICKMVGLYGLTGITAATSPAFGAAIIALRAACEVFEAADNYPGERDAVAPDGVEDL